VPARPHSGLAANAGAAIIDMGEAGAIMASGPTEPTEARAPGGPRSPRGEASPLVRSARSFAARCHGRQRRESDGAAFIEHPLEVARLLRDAGCSDVVIAAGLLHDVIEDTQVSATELRARFGSAVVNLVQAVSDDASIESYRRRKRLLREQVRRAGSDAAVLFAADKISKVRELPDLVRRDRARTPTTPLGDRARNQLAHDHQMRLEHYHESLSMLQHVVAQHPLTQRLADELRACPITVSGQMAAGHGLL
jgi:(p)ppGpp synthase/HD superfamily hydrolase